VDDAAWTPSPAEFADAPLPDQIAGVRVQRLTGHRDPRGELTVLLTSLHDEQGVAPHVYVVVAEPRSTRAWVYHNFQCDRLAYIERSFRLVLSDLRPESSTHGRLNVFDVGAENRVLVMISPYVVHGIKNLGSRPASFVNVPTRAHDPARPDKSRLSHDHPRIPYAFD